MSRPDRHEGSGVRRSDDAPGERASPRGMRLLGTGWLPIAGVLLLALFLRLWGVFWGLPVGQDVSSYHPDEAVNLFSGVLDRGVPRPHLDLGFYNYGGLFFYLWQILVAVNQAYNLVSLPMGAPVYAGAPSSLTVGSLILVGRLLTVACGVLTAWVLYATGARLFSKYAGAVAAALWAVAPIAVVHGHFATVDVTATLFGGLTLLFAARAITTGGGLRDIALAGLCSGLAGATKYNCVLVACSVVAAVLLKEQDAGARARALAVSVGATVAGFLAGCPGALVNPSKFLSDFAFEATKTQQGMGALFAGTGPGWVYHVTVSLRYGLAMPLLLVCLAAVAHAVLRRDRATLMLLAYVIPYYLLIGYAQVRFMRYVIPLLPPLLLLAARSLSQGLPYRTRLSRALSGVGAIVFLVTLLIAIALDRQMVGPDARDEARDYIAAHVPAGRAIAFATTPFHYTPRLIPAFGAPVPGAARRRMVLEASSPWLLRLPEQDREWDLSVLTPPPDYVLVTDLETEDALRLRDSRALAWLAKVTSQYEARVFENIPSVLGLSLGKPAWLPNDWLYICPRVTLYTRTHR